MSIYEKHTHSFRPNDCVMFWCRDTALVYLYLERHPRCDAAFEKHTQPFQKKTNNINKSSLMILSNCCPISQQLGGGGLKCYHVCTRQQYWRKSKDVLKMEQGNWEVNCLDIEM